MPERRGTSHSHPIAVIDIGSNSGRVMVFEREALSNLRLLAGSRASLRLVHDVDARAQLSEATMPRTMDALRLSEKFLDSDPPSGKQLRRLRDHVRSRLAKARVGRLRSGDRLVGTGGTLRNLAKIDRQTRRYPVGRLHGYELSVDRIADV